MSRGKAQYQRVAIAVAIGLGFGGWSLALRMSGRTNFSDFDQIWIAARSLLHGENAYEAVASGFSWPLYYPLPAVLVGVPFAPFPEEWAGPLFTAVGFTLLAYGLLGRGPWHLVPLLSYPALFSAELNQWAPLLTASALLPGLAWTAAAKPTTGLAVAGAYFSRRAIVLNVTLAVGLLCVSFALDPHWVSEWLANVRAARHFVAPVAAPGGVLLLLAALRWRLPEARLLLLLAVIPQVGSPYDALPLLLICSTRGEALGFGLITIATMPMMKDYGTGEAFLDAVHHNLIVNLFTLYLPALVIVLSRRRPVPGPGSGAW